jgi:hypothetical protein
MTSIAEYVKRADELAQDVVNAWGVNVQAGNGTHLSAKFMNLFERAYSYRIAKRIADNHRQFAILTELDAVEEEAARQVFADAYKDFWGNEATGRVTPGARLFQPLEGSVF